MKKNITLLTLSLIVAITNCAGSVSSGDNTTMSKTNAELSKKNFTVLDAINGVSSHTYAIRCG